MESGERGVISHKDILCYVYYTVPISHLFYDMFSEYYAYSNWKVKNLEELEFIPTQLISAHHDELSEVFSDKHTGIYIIWLPKL